MPHRTGVRFWLSHQAVIEGVLEEFNSATGKDSGNLAPRDLSGAL